MDRRLHILVLSDRDWTHPEAGGTGTTFRELVGRWTAAGHHVTMIAGAYPGAPAYERPQPNLHIHRMGNRLTVFPRAAVAFLRGTGRHADVVLEMVNGIAFFTPWWPTLRELSHGVDEVKGAFQRIDQLVFGIWLVVLARAATATVQEVDPARR